MELLQDNRLASNHFLSHHSKFHNWLTQLLLWITLEYIHQQTLIYLDLALQQQSMLNPLGNIFICTQGPQRQRTSQCTSSKKIYLGYFTPIYILKHQFINKAQNIFTFCTPVSVKINHNPLLPFLKTNYSLTHCFRNISDKTLTSQMT